MKKRKITVEVPVELLGRAQKVTGAGITQTICEGLKAMLGESPVCGSASRDNRPTSKAQVARAYAQMLKWKGSFRFSQSLKTLKSDR